MSPKFAKQMVNRFPLAVNDEQTLIKFYAGCLNDNDPNVVQAAEQYLKEKCKPSFVKKVKAYLLLS